ncbi:MAG: hypothetical protein IKL16_03010 [Clostridia bacterium]|nr:hypothetical protein [Clostridia bacterium]
MKKINSLSLCFTFAGCFLGAGYVSGQELLQFFSSFGKMGYIGLLLAVILQVIFGILLINLAMKTGIFEMDKIIIPWEKPFLRNVFGVLEEILLFGIFVIMSAGTGALFEQIFSLPFWVGSLVICVITALLAIKGVGAMVKVFSYFVPVLVAVTLGISFYSIIKNGFPEIPSVKTGENPLLSNWIVSSLTFVSYNIFGSIGILTLVGKSVKKKSTVFTGVSSGGVMLLVIALGILFSISVSGGNVEKELPMLFVAKKINVVLGFVYAFLLFGGMLGTSVSSVVALEKFMETKSEKIRKKPALTVIVLCAMCFLLSLVGFSDLVGFIYPVFGYLGFIALVLIIVNYLRLNSCRR